MKKFFSTILFILFFLSLFADNIKIEPCSVYIDETRGQVSVPPITNIKNSLYLCRRKDIPKEK